MVRNQGRASLGGEEQTWKGAELGGWSRGPCAHSGDPGRSLRDRSAQQLACLVAEGWPTNRGNLKEEAEGSCFHFVIFTGK